MNTKRFKYIIAFVLTFMALPMMAQDYMNIFFKNGDFRKFYMKNITGITATKVDVDGIEHDDYISQQITTIYDKYIYKLEDVDSITFTKIDEELAEQNFVSAMPKVFTEIEDCQTMENVEDKIDEIRKAEGVADAWSDGHQLYVSIAEGETFKFNFYHEAPYKKNVIKDAATRVRALSPQLESIIRQKSIHLKALIANQIDKNEDEDFEEIKQSYLIPLYDFFQDCGIDVQYEPNPDIDFFYNNSDDPEHLHFYDYDIVLLMTHGGYGNIIYNSPKGVDFWGREKANAVAGIKGHSFVTSEDIGKPIKAVDEESWEKYYRSFKEWRDKTPYHDLTDVHINYTFIPEKRDGKNVWIAHPELTEYFFRDIAKGEFNSSNSFFFNFACSSLEGDNNQPSYSFAKILMEKRNLGIYAGFTNTNFSAPVASRDFLHSIFSGYSVGKSFEDLNEWCKKETVENVEEDVDSFLECFEQKDLDEIRSGEWLLDGAELKIIDLSENLPSDFFLFPTVTIELDEELVNQSFLSNQSVTIKGLTTFYGDSDLQKGFKYSTNPNSLSQNIQAEKETAVGSERGNCQYEVKISNLEPDTEYYYQAYTFDGEYYNYGEICSFKTPAEIPSEAVDLGLPSGTLWAKWNMGATAPEEYGDYYAWGETETKKGYGWYNYEHCDGTDDTCHDIGAEISGTKYDVAHVKWGGDWQLPTSKQIDELVKYCQHKVTTSKGVKGTLVTGPNGNTIFLPCAGFMSGTKLYGPGKYGLYKSGTRCGSDLKESWLLNADADGFVRIGIWNSTGHSIRPVISGK